MTMPESLKLEHKIVYTLLLILWGMVTTLVGFMWSNTNRSIVEILAEQKAQSRDAAKRDSQLAALKEQIEVVNGRVIRIEGMFFRYPLGTGDIKDK